MTDTPAPDMSAPEPPRPARSKLPLLIGLVLALAGGGGGFYAVYSGLLFGAPAERPAALPDIAFVAIEPMVISLGPGTGNSHLRFAATLEVPRRQQAEVSVLMPRIVDVLNGYLRAVTPQELADPGALIRLRAQMLRRVQIVTGDGRVRDLLITEFVMN